MSKKYYSVFDSIEKKWFIYDVLTPAKNKTKNSDENVLKKFKTFKDAWNYAIKNSTGALPLLKLKNISVAQNLDEILNKKICPLCEKPHNQKTQCCFHCHKKRKELGMSISKLIYFKNKIGEGDIISYLEDNPNANILAIDKKIIKDDKKKVLSEIRSVEYVCSQYEAWSGDYPLYIEQLFSKYPKVDFQTLSGSKMNPNIHYRCLACGEEHITKQVNHSVNFSHNCISIKPSGEIAVEKLLRGTCSYLTQFDTIKCINPITNRQLPYDFELPNNKIIIEVHGQQHFQYIPHFHSSEEDFEYQIFKDRIKHEFGIAKGYEIIYIDYKQIKSGEYKSMINEATNSQ